LFIVLEFTTSLLRRTWRWSGVYVNSQMRQESINAAERSNLPHGDMLLEACTRTLDPGCFHQAVVYLVSLDSDKLFGKFVNGIWKTLQDRYRISSPAFSLPYDIKTPYSALIQHLVERRVRAYYKSEVNFPATRPLRWRILRSTILYAYNLEVTLDDDMMEHGICQISRAGVCRGSQARVGLWGSDVISRRDYGVHTMLHAHEL
ncbi:hypothetical protein BD311DRAFT_679059, partial [Dichomitus squalens]